jgi:hypothetical protein
VLFSKIKNGLIKEELLDVNFSLTLKILKENFLLQVQQIKHLKYGTYKKKHFLKLFKLKPQNKQDLMTSNLRSKYLLLNWE